MNKRVQVLECNLKNDKMISVCFQGKPFNITVIQVYAPTSNAEETEVEQFYEDLQDLLELTSKKDVLLLCCWKRMFAMTSAFSWQNSISLCPASFRIPSPNLPVTPGVS